jgi:hypothetical protein
MRSKGKERGVVLHPEWRVQVFSKDVNSGRSITPNFIMEN